MKHVWTGEECTVSHNFLGQLGPEDQNFQCWGCSVCGQPKIPYDQRDEECPGPEGIDAWETFLDSAFAEGSDPKPKMFIYKGILYEPTGDGRYTPEPPQELLDIFRKVAKEA